MKVEVNVLEDQIEILRRFQSLPELIKNHIGKLPVDLKGVDSHLRYMDDSIANLEFQCKKWIIETSFLNSKLNEFFDGIKVASTDTRVSDYD